MGVRVMVRHTRILPTRDSLRRRAVARGGRAVPGGGRRCFVLPTTVTCAPDRGRWSPDAWVVRIGSVERPLGPPQSHGHHLPPRGPYGTGNRTLLSHWQWMMQKDALGQDMLLIGPPGSPSAVRRDIALAWADLLHRPAHVLTVTSDMTESDLKQRRELVRADNHESSSSSSSSSGLQLQFVPAAPVAAALAGHILVLDGLERASRNVLPTLNNLLEHRSMTLEDGRSLLHPDRYHALHQVNPLDTEGFLPVHPDFRVIATCVPAPHWPGRPLDPPLRSRFQVRRIQPNSVDEALEIMAALAAAGPTSPETGQDYSHATPQTNMRDEKQARDGAVRQLVMLMEHFRQETALSVRKEDPSAATWPLPLHHVPALQHLANHFPRRSLHSLVGPAYPVGVPDERLPWYAAQAGNRRLLDMALEQVGDSIHAAAHSPYTLTSIDRQRNDQAELTFTSTARDAESWPTALGWKTPPAGSSPFVTITAPCGSLEPTRVVEDYYLTDRLKDVVQDMLMWHSCGKDLLLVSPPGESKSSTASYFASLLGYRTTLIHVFPEMSLADLFLRRATHPLTGETRWEASPLLHAIQQGELCILDGIEKLRPDVLAALQSLCLARDLFLPDGRRIRPPVNAHAAADSGDDDSQLIRTHPSFRLVGLAASTEDSGAWLTEDAMSMFATIVIPPLSDDCMEAILTRANQGCSQETLKKLLKLRALLSKEVAADCGVNQLSTRNLLRIVQQMNTTPVGEAIRQVLVTDLLPPSQRSTLESVLETCGFRRRRSKEGHRTAPSGETDDPIVVDDTVIRIGNFEMARAKVERPELVPAPRFFDIPSHVATIKDLLKNWCNGERAFLLLGNQGVGKNMIIDRLCEVANFEREYVQLHRDSTIPQLTIQPSLQNGLIVWKDSPLVRAVERGCMLVVDEADKAPTEVLAVLKGLVEDGELLLGDGRRISRHETGTNIIRMHDNFTLVVLANRPGFPFQGNQFFKLIGDCFSTRVVSNPDIESEISLLQQYGPDVEERLIRSIAGSFAELRSQADRGDLVYPYSTREAVAVIKHKQKYPMDDIVTVLHNVLDFDSYDMNTYGRLGEVFQQHGIPVESYKSWMESMSARNESLTLDYAISGHTGELSSHPPPIGLPKEGKWDDKNEAHVGGNQWAGGTGGSNTAGLGGRAGPYRLDRGHQVHQISEEKKAEVSEEVLRAARAMAAKALQERLAEINMSETEWDMYQRFVEPIKGEISNLRSILRQVELRKSEEAWIKRQSHGEIDDSRLVEGVTGEKLIYKRRGLIQDAAPQMDRKKLCFVVDVSGSMYRFNGYDQRLYRCLESVNLVMESFDGMQHRFDYQIVGHSGDSPNIPFVKFGAPPTSEKQRMRILQGMIAHSQYCDSGDHTLEAVELAIADLARTSHGDVENDGGIVIAVSDANLKRYGIQPHYLGRIIEKGNEQKVKTHCIFIGTLGEEAEEIRRELPPGRGYVCMQTKELPMIIKNILSTNM